MHNKVAFFGVFLALALILSYIESCIPFTFGVPGMKLGLTNLIVVLFLYLYGGKPAMLLNVLRIILVGFLFGNAFAIFYSLAGGILSFLAMCVFLRRLKLHIITVSVIGGVMHNIGQLMVACLLMENYYLYLYAPMLVLAGMITGGIIGVIASAVYPALHKISKIEGKN